jgi:hypothetical protein
VIVITKAPVKKGSCSTRLGKDKTSEYQQGQESSSEEEEETKQAPILERKDSHKASDMVQNPEETTVSYLGFGGKPEPNPFDPSEDDARFTPISALTCHSTDWIIKARISKKYPRRNWQNQRGVGYLMSIDLID